MENGGLNVKSLDNMYSEIAKDSTRWSYYEESVPDICDVWRKNNSAYEFIMKYFDLSGKKRVFEDKLIGENKEYIKERAPHIVSTFLLGIKIAECFEFDIKTRNTDNLDFRYYWFLACLYHDIGYVYEEGKEFFCGELDALQVDGLEAIQEICNIKYLHNRVFKTYTKEQVDLYLKCRATCKNGERGKIDHGIAGGLLLYDKLRRNFEIAWKKTRKERKNKEVSRSEFFIESKCDPRRLRLSNKDYEAYACAADAIIAHNIWRETLNEYIDENCSNIDKITKRIDSKNKLCFILSIADTIEPLKRLQNEEPEILSKIYFEDIPDGFRIWSNEENLKVLEHFRNFESLEDWVDIKVKKDEKNSFSFTLETRKNMKMSRCID